MSNLRACRVTCVDLKGVAHTVEVTAESLYEAVAMAYNALGKNGWAGELPSGMAKIEVEVAQPIVNPHRSRQGLAAMACPTRREPARLR